MASLASRAKGCMFSSPAGKAETGSAGELTSEEEPGGTHGGRWAGLV